MIHKLSTPLSTILLMSAVLVATGVKVIALPSPAVPVEPEPASAAPMDNALMDDILHTFDPNLEGGPGGWVIRINSIPAQIVTDESADRMRIMIAIRKADDLDKEALYRLMQANFESALDARYAIAQGMVWSTYIHPLGPLTESQLLSALAQTYNAALTFGTTFSSGVFQYGGGDGRNEIYDEIIEKGTRS